MAQAKYEVFALTSRDRRFWLVFLTLSAVFLAVLCAFGFGVFRRGGVRPGNPLRPVRIHPGPIPVKPQTPVYSLPPASPKAPPITLQTTR